MLQTYWFPHVIWCYKTGVKRHDWLGRASVPGASLLHRLSSRLKLTALRWWHHFYTAKGSGDLLPIFIYSLCSVPWKDRHLHQLVWQSPWGSLTWHKLLTMDQWAWKNRHSGVTRGVRSDDFKPLDENCACIHYEQQILFFYYFYYHNRRSVSESRSLPTAGGVSSYHCPTWNTYRVAIAEWASQKSGCTSQNPLRHCSLSQE